MTPRPLHEADVAMAAAVHALAFEEAWPAADIGALLRGHGGFGAVIAAPEGEAQGEIAGFILCRLIADEAEVLTLATRPDLRRRGIATALLAAAVAVARAGGGARLFLEVAQDNPAAIALYLRSGFREVARRPAYYRRAGGAAASDALVLRLDLNR